jgi:positive regulator of sigma E activity
MEGMVEHLGTVISIADGKARIAVDASGCDGCGHGDSCAMSRLSRQGGETAEMEFPIHDAGLQSGDQVRLRFPESRMPLNAALGYLVPALAVLLGSGLGNSVDGNPGAMLGALGGFVLSMLFSRFVLPRFPSMLPIPDIEAVAPAPAHLQPHDLPQPHA